ncbi:MAG: response regulator, partial [Anaerolineae bacterium]|nr:response regulator [Anaerolineae bacterium]
SMPGSLGSAQALGIHDYLIKPIVRQRLLEAIERLGKDVRSVLILDDDQQLVELLGRMLESAGRKYRPIKAFGGEDVLTRMRRRRPDMVLLDLVMSDGLAVLEAMRADSFLADIPVIVISAPEYLETRMAKGDKRWG